MLKPALILYFLFILFPIIGQTKKFNNSAVKGKAITCQNYNEKYPCYDSACRKIGKWIYYYKNGSIQRIENYRKIKDCSLNEIPDGLWKFYDKQGRLIKQDEYKSGVLWTSDVEKYYFNEQLAGIIQIRNGVLDTLKYIELNDSNYIQNGDFEMYFGQPQPQINDGQSEISKQIPFWYSWEKNTPDYYNPFRRFRNVPNNLSPIFYEKYTYVGIILYHKPTGHYSEYITGLIYPNLESGEKYCLKIRVRLSQNSGFTIDKLGILFSDGIPNVESSIPQIVFNQKLDNRDNWLTLCSKYTATGNEKYITIGRFVDLNNVTISSITPGNLSEGEYNQSAYYLVDDVELKNDTIDCKCQTKYVEDGLTNRVNFDWIDPEDSLIMDKTFVLNNIFFEFDKSELLPSSLQELKKLLEFLQSNDFSIMISGHTDNIGSDDYNKALSLDRARAVSAWLVDHGIEKHRIDIAGYGPELPIVDNDTEENRSVNRRVEFWIKKQ